MPVGPILLVILFVAIAFGLVDRTLHRMRLAPRTALLFTAAALIGNLGDLSVRPGLIINAGSAIIPLLFILYLLLTERRWRAVLGTLGGAAVVGGVVFLVGRWFSPAEPTELNLFYLDAQYLYALVGGLTCCAVAREPRTAFSSAVLGVLGADLGAYVRYLLSAPGRPWLEQLGGGGFQDTAIVAALLAVCLVRWVSADAKERVPSHG